MDFSCNIKSLNSFSGFSGLCFCACVMCDSPSVSSCLVVGKGEEEGEDERTHTNKHTDMHTYIFASSSPPAPPLFIKGVPLTKGIGRQETIEREQKKKGIGEVQMFGESGPRPVLTIHRLLRCCSWSC